jgi:hypothetical protein
MRADYADYMIDLAEKQGIDTLNEEAATGLGTLVAAMTGRGGLRNFEPAGDTLNKLFFSPRFLMANFDTLTAHVFDPKATGFARKEAAKNLLKMAATVGGFLAVTKMVNPDAVDNDPRKGRFGKIRIGQNDIDITGGLGGLVQLASRLFPFSTVDGVAGSWKYSPSSGKWVNMRDPGYGESTLTDYLGQFFSGKVSPLTGAIRDLANDENFEGQSPTAGSTLASLFMPITPATIYKSLQRGDDHAIVVALLEANGFSTTNTTMRGYGDKWEALSQKIPQKEYDQVLVQMTEDFNEELQKAQDAPSWQRLETEEKNAKMDSIRKKLSDRVFSKYGIKTKD